MVTKRINKSGSILRSSSSQLSDPAVGVCSKRSSRSASQSKGPSFVSTSSLAEE